MGNDIKVSSFNVRIQSERDGKNAFINRHDFLIEGIHEIDAEIFGFQEVSPMMAEHLKAGMKNYTFIGIGREADYTGEHTYIAYKSDKFDIFSVENFWLSDTPDVPGSRFMVGQGDCPRICTVAKLVHFETKKIISFYNTHLDYRGAPARLNGIKIILEKVKLDKYPAIITGDFNCTPDSEPVSEVLNSGLNLKDATSQLKDTYHGFGREPEVKIDYIFTDLDYKDTYQVRKISDEGIYLSDHDAVVTTVTIN